MTVETLISVHARSITYMDYTLKYTLMPIGYPFSFINHHSQPPRTIVAEIPTHKLKITIHLTFRGDNVMQCVDERLSTAISQT